MIGNPGSRGNRKLRDTHPMRRGGSSVRLISNQRVVEIDVDHTARAVEVRPTRSDDCLRKPPTVVYLISSYHGRITEGSGQGLRKSWTANGRKPSSGGSKFGEEAKNRQGNGRSPPTLSIEGDGCRTAYATLVSV